MVDYKQVIVIRKDLKMGAGKLAGAGGPCRGNGGRESEISEFILASCVV